jgi:hypothetical protein
MKTTEKIHKTLPSLKFLVERFENNVQQGIKEIQDLKLLNKYPSAESILVTYHFF